MEGSPGPPAYAFFIYINKRAQLGRAPNCPIVSEAGVSPGCRKLILPLHPKSTASGYPRGPETQPDLETKPL